MDATHVLPATPSAGEDAGLRRKGIIAFLAITFGLTWIPFLAIPLGLAHSERS